MIVRSGTFAMLDKESADIVVGPLRIYPDDLRPALQETLAILADIDFLHEQERERLEAWDAAPAAKEALERSLAVRREAARAPYLMRLEELRLRMRALAWARSA